MSVKNSAARVKKRRQKALEAAESRVKQWKDNDQRKLTIAETDVVNLHKKLGFMGLVKNDD